MFLWPSFFSRKFLFSVSLAVILFKKLFVQCFFGHHSFQEIFCSVFLWPSFFSRKFLYSVSLAIILYKKILYSVSLAIILFKKIFVQCFFAKETLNKNFLEKNDIVSLTNFLTIKLMICCNVHVTMNCIFKSEIKYLFDQDAYRFAISSERFPACVP